MPITFTADDFKANDKGSDKKLTFSEEDFKPKSAAPQQPAAIATPSPAPVKYPLEGSNNPYAPPLHDPWKGFDTSPIPEGSLTFSPNPYDAKGKFIPSDAEKLARGFVTPKNAIIALATGGDSLVGKAAATYFGIQGIKGASESAKVLLDPNASQDEKHDAKLNLFVDLPMAAAGAHGFKEGTLGAVNKIRDIPESADILPKAKAAAIESLNNGPTVTANKTGITDISTSEKAPPASAEPKAETASINPGGAQADLPPEQQAVSKANNAKAAWGDFAAAVEKQKEAPPSTEPTPATPSPESKGNDKVAPLEPEHQEMIDSEAKDGGHNVEVVTGPINENEPFARQIATVDRKTGKILINPKELTTWLKSRGKGGVPEGQERAAIRSLLSEEAIHLATPDDAALDYHNSLTSAERAIGQRVYGGPKGAKLSPTMLGHEMLRIRMQKLARMGVRETIVASTRERWTVKSLLAASDAIRTIRETLGTRSAKEGGAIIDRIQQNIEAALNKTGGETPGAKRKGSDEGTPEFFLPPIKEGEERPSAAEAGALPEVKIPPEQALKTDTVLWNKPNAWRRVTSELLHKPASLGKMLTEGSRATESDPVSATRRLVAMEKDGKVDVVSIYPDAEDGARAVDPAYAGKRARPNVPIKALLDEGYKPIVSMLRTEAVQNFHRHFDSVDQFEQTVGKPGDDQWANVPGYEAQTAETQSPSFGKGSEMTDAEAGALHDHLIEHPTVDAAAEAIASSKNVQQIRSALSKAIHQVMGADKSLTREEAAGKAMEQLYEQSQSAKHRNDFIKNALGEFGKESPESAGHVPGETVNDLGREPETAEDYHPAAIRKFAEEQVKLTDDDIKSYVSGRKVKDNIARAYDAAVNIPNLVAEREALGIRYASGGKPSWLDRKLATWKGKKENLSGANALVQAQAVRDNGTIDHARKGQIPIFKALVQKGMTEAQNWINSGNWRQRRMGEAWMRSQKELMSELEYADAHWNDPELQATAARMKQSLDEQWKRERAAGIEVSKDLNYVPQRYDAAVWNEHSILFNAIEGSEKILGGKFRKPRTFDTYYAAGAEGPYIPVTRDGASLVGHRVRQGMNMISRDAWANGLKSVSGPSGQPVAVDAKISATGQLQPPTSRDYSNMLIGGKAIGIHDDFHGVIDNLTAPSKIENWPVTRGALRMEQMMKHGLLLGDFFHLGRMMYYGTSIMGKNLNFKGGWSVLDIKLQDIKQAVKLGIIHPEDAAWGNERTKFGSGTVTRRQLAEKFVGAGANLGKIQDALYKDLITDLTPAASPLARAANRVIDPSVGRYNRFLFDKLTRGLMAEANVREFERQHAANPSANPDALIKDISRDVNNYFGNIGKQGWMKSATQKDLARLLLLAPDWLEGLIKKEAVTYSRASGLSKTAGTREGVSNLGTTGRGIGRGLIFLAGVAQAVNLITRRQPTWKNDEKGHKFDAWIPGFGKDSNGFWFSPLSIFNEITHDLWRYSQTDKTVMGAIDQVAGNKESPLTRAAIMTLIGSGAIGGKPTTSAGQIKGAVSQLAPMPLTFGRYAQAAGHAVAPSLVPPTPPGSLQRQSLASLGLKTEPAMSPAQDISQKAQDFAKANGLSRETGWQQVETDEPSYSKLRTALRSGDEAGAKKQYEALGKTRTNKQIFHAMKLASKRPFTGSKAGENAFIRSLDDKELAEYQKALEQRTKEYQAFEDFMLRQP